MSRLIDALLVCSFLMKSACIFERKWGQGSRFQVHLWRAGNLIGISLPIKRQNLDSRKKGNISLSLVEGLWVTGSGLLGNYLYRDVVNDERGKQSWMFKTKQTGFLCFYSPYLCPSPQGWNVFHSLHSLNWNWMCLSVKGARGVRFNFYHFSIYLEAHLRGLSLRDTSPVDIKAHPARGRARTSFSGSAQACLVWVTWKIQPGTVSLSGALHSPENLNIGTDTLCL